MNLFIKPLIITPTLLAHALGWTLLHFLWQGALIAAVLACILSLLSGRAPQPRYLASCCALVLMTILPAVTFTRILTEPVNTAAAITLSIDATSTLTHGHSSPNAPLLERIATALDHAMPALLALWCIGVAILLIRLAAGLLLASRMKSATTQPAPEDLLRTLRRLARRIGVSRPVQLLNSAIVQVPTVIGWLRPVVLIPFGCLAGLSPLQIEAILAHELAHIRRHDYLISVLQSTIEALLFYHPAVWWVSQNIRREREHCCDDLAVQLTGDPLTYARALSLLEERRATLPTIALAINGGNLTMRIKRLLQSQDTQPTTQLTALTLLAVVLIATATCITTAARAQSNRTPNATLKVITEEPRTPEPGITKPITTTPAINPQYQLWIDEDVRWNIEPAERNAFLNLTTDLERDHFIDQFWQRRSPAGATPTAAREEHYRRIAYTNDTFTAANTPGWQTDRGHIYIVNGAPNSIDSHGPSPDGPAYEIWHYNSASTRNGITFKFVDTCKCGNLQFASWSSDDLKNFSLSTAPQQQSSGAQPPRTPTQSHAANADNSTSLAPRAQTPKPASKPTLHQASYHPPLQQSSTPPLRAPASAMAGSLLTRVNPVYPPDAKANGIEGAVILNAIISKTGEVDRLQVTTGSPELAASAMDAVRQWKYKPYLLNGEPTEVQTTITVNYHLTDTAASRDQAQDQSQGMPPSTASHVAPGAMAGNLLSRVNPVYPPEAKANGIEGAVILNATISKTGEVENLQVTSGPIELQASALNAVRQWKYKPYLLNGEPTEVQTTITVNYHLSGSAQNTTPHPATPASPTPTASASGVVPKKIGNGVSAPRVISQVDPEYTAHARETKTAGSVLLGLWVDTKGNPVNVHVVRSLDKGLDANAITAVKKYKFKPAMENGKPVLVALNLEVNFQIF
jgi:TonB family protein